MLRRELKLVFTNLKWGKHVQKIRIILVFFHFKIFANMRGRNSSQLPVKIKAVDNKCRANIACSCRGHYPNPEIIQEKMFLYNFEAAALLKASFVSLLVLRDRRIKLPSRRHHDKFPLYIIQSEEKELCAEIS